MERKGEITAEQVKKLPHGEHVIMHIGRLTRHCTVVQSGRKKVLVWHSMTSQNVYKILKEDENIWYSMREEDE